MSGVPLIGARISLISKNEIRYEGVLYEINKVDTTIAIKDVVSLGTEERLTEKFVPPNDKIYGFIKFRGIDIRDLHVHKTPEQAAAAMRPKPPLSPDPVASVPEITFGTVGATPPPPPPRQQKEKQQQQQLRNFRMKLQKEMGVRTKKKKKKKCL
mmetsp:Transcript_20518/g.42044  ORF Transcript_20518/g.42044 Transcript_20518/m.42044 type:complete len:155 (+) Transcript_20518:55-519(+)